MSEFGLSLIPLALSPLPLVLFICTNPCDRSTPSLAYLCPLAQVSTPRNIELWLEAPCHKFHSCIRLVMLRAADGFPGHSAVELAPAPSSLSRWYDVPPILSANSWLLRPHWNDLCPESFWARSPASDCYQQFLQAADGLSGHCAVEKLFFGHSALEWPLPGILLG